MIPTIDEIIDKHTPSGRIWESGTHSAIKRMLKEYGNQVVDECASTFKWEWDCQDEHDAIEIVDPDTIEEVKSQIK